MGCLNPPNKDPGSVKKKRWEDRKNQGWWCQTHLTDVNSEAVAASTGPVQVQTRQNPSTEKGKWTQSSTLTKKPFAIDESELGVLQ